LCVSCIPAKTAVLIEIAGLYIFAYLVGSVPTAYLIGKLARGIDLRQYGSSNVGGSNLVYHVGKRWLVPLGFFEVLVKGALPVLVGQHLLGLERASPQLLIAPLLAIAGHNWPVFLKFQGGRGVAVLSGTLLALAPLLLAAFAVVFLAGWLSTRSSGVWALISLALLPIWAVIIGEPSMISWYCMGALGLVVLKRLLSNWSPFPQEVPRKKVLFNRLFRDRDVDDRADWITRVPEETK
jgi:acyl phosphate:glycerol-3-phosphate acyltransferase